MRAVRWTILLLLAAVASCARDSGPRAGGVASAADPPYDRTIVVDSPEWTADIVPDCERSTPGDLPGPDGRVTLPDVLCVAAGRGTERYRVVLDFPGDATVAGRRWPTGGTWLPERIAVLEAPAGKRARLKAAALGVEGFLVRRGENAPLLVRRLEFDGFRSTAIFVVESSRGPIRIEDCAFARNERGLYNEGRNLTVRRCLFADNTLIGIKTRGGRVAVEDSRFERTGSPARDHGCYGFFAENASDVAVRGSLFDGTFGEPHQAWAVWVGGSANVRIEGNVFLRNRTTDVAIEKSTDVQVLGNGIVGGPRPDAGTSVVVVQSGCRRVHLWGNAIEGGSGNAVTVECAAGNRIAANAITGGAGGGIRWIGCDAIHDQPADVLFANRVTGVAGQGILLQGPGPRSTPLTVLGNLLTGNGAGVDLQGKLAGAVVRDNLVEGSRETGIRVNEDSDGIVLTGNRVTRSGRDGIVVLSRGNVVTRNRSAGNGGKAIVLASPDAQREVEDNSADGTRDAKRGCGG